MKESALINRAIAAYFRAANKETGGIGQVMQPSSQVVEIDGLTYVHMFNTNGTLAVYRVRIVAGKPVLKGLKRWPKELA